jgi:hypothetical protein
LAESRKDALHVHKLGSKFRVRRNVYMNIGKHWKRYQKFKPFPIRLGAESRTLKNVKYVLPELPRDRQARRILLFFTITVSSLPVLRGLSLLERRIS